MLHREHRQLDADHVPDLACPEAGAVHHVLGVHGAFVGDYVPCAVATLAKCLHASEPLDGRAELPRSLCIGVSRAGWVAVAAIRPPQRTDEMARLDERVV